MPQDPSSPTPARGRGRTSRFLFWPLLALVAYALVTTFTLEGYLTTSIPQGQDPSLALRNLDDASRADLVLRNIRQFEKRDDENQTCYYETDVNYWWYWWNNDIETNAWILRAIVKLEPGSDVAPRLVKWLLNNRRNGYYWRSTRDTTLCVAAVSDFVVASGEGTPDYILRFDFDDGACLAVNSWGQRTALKVEPLPGGLQGVVEGVWLVTWLRQGYPSVSDFWMAKKCSPSFSNRRRKTQVD